MPKLTAAEEEAIVTRAGLSVVLGGTERTVAPLVIADNRAWKDKVIDAIAERWGALGGVGDWKDVVRMLAGSDDALLDLLLAYDTDATLGGREWIEHHATAREVLEAFKVVAKEAFPLGDAALASYPALVGLLVGAAGERMKADEPVDEPPAQESSTSSS
jgi:hypothetical protein